MKNTDNLDRRTLIATVNWLIFSVVVIGTIAKYFALDGANPPRVGLVLAVILAANGIYLQRGGSANAAAVFILSSMYIGFIVAGYNTGAFKGPIVYLAPILPVLSVLLLNRKAGWIGLVAILLSLLMLSLLQYFGKTSALLLGDTGGLISKYAVLSCSCLVTTWVVWDFARQSNAFAEANLTNANTDFLTGIANRRKIADALEQEIERARRSDSWLSLILIDVDNFKHYNDSSGHQAGDRCLIMVSDVIASFAMRPIDVVGRFGGDEFILILPNANASATCEIADKIRREMQVRKSSLDQGLSDELSLTLGVVSMKGQAVETPERIIQLADKALYYGKDQGKNCVVNAVFEAQTGSTKFERQ
ncbi:MAG: GGDEF domain-containing protein [Oceanicoccus sp.]